MTTFIKKACKKAKVPHLKPELFQEADLLRADVALGTGA